MLYNHFRKFLGKVLYSKCCSNGEWSLHLLGTIFSGGLTTTSFSNEFLQQQVGESGIEST